MSRMWEATAEDLARARTVLAEVAQLHEARGAALDATGLVTFTDRQQWLALNPIDKWLPADNAPSPYLLALQRELNAARADGFSTRFSTRSVPKPKRRRMAPFVPTDTQLAIALRVAQRKESA